MRTRLLCVIPLLIAMSCAPAKGVFVRVAETGCETLVELVGADDVVTRLCVLAADLAVLLTELAAAEREGRDAVIDTAGARYVVPVRHLRAARVSAMGAVK
tara:strand:+ start:4677 stop:4979 length:303 start_codon:yes stop_codon:yes gene_type:complete